MNQSPFIDPDDCASCGECCKSFRIGYSKKHDKALLSEVERFKLLDSDLIKVHEDKNGYWVEFLIACKHLKKDEKGCSCAIYAQKRPELCERYPYAGTVECPHMKKQSQVRPAKPAI
jgi:Fe-S-cluster containining protein